MAKNVKKEQSKFHTGKSENVVTLKISKILKMFFGKIRKKIGE